MQPGQYKIYISEDEPPPSRLKPFIFGVITGLMLALCIAVSCGAT